MTASYQTGTGYRDPRPPEREAGPAWSTSPTGRQIRLETARDVPHAFGACFSSGPAARGDAQHGVMAMPGLADAAHPPRQPIAQNSRGWPHLYG